MKKLLNTTLLACAFTLLLVACSKDKKPEPPFVTLPVPAVQSVTVKSKSVDVSFNGYTSLIPSTRFTLSVGGVIIDEFSLNGASKKKWQFNNLFTGKNTVKVSYSPHQDDNQNYGSFHFDIDDHNSIQAVSTSGQITNDFTFEIEVIN